MLLNDPLQNLRCGRVIPHAVRIYHCDRSILANAQAIRFRPVDDSLALNQPELGEAAFEIFPCRYADLARRTLRRGLIGTKKDVALDAPDPEARGFLIER